MGAIAVCKHVKQERWEIRTKEIDWVRRLSDAAYMVEGRLV